MKRSYKHEYLPSMKCSYGGHRGLCWADDSIMFYGIRFDKPSDAFNMIRLIEPSEHYRPWCYSRHKGIFDKKTNRVFVCERWFDTEKLAELYLDNVARQIVYKN